MFPCSDLQVQDALSAMQKANAAAQAALPAYQQQLSAASYTALRAAAVTAAHTADSAVALLQQVGAHGMGFSPHCMGCTVLLVLYFEESG